MPSSPSVSGSSSSIQSRTDLPQQQGHTAPVAPPATQATQQQHNPALALQQQQRRARANSMDGRPSLHADTGTRPRSASDGALDHSMAMRHGLIQSPPSNLSRAQSRMAQHVQHAVEEQISGTAPASPTESVSSLALDDSPPGPPPSPEEAQAQLDAALKDADEAIQFMASVLSAVQPQLGSTTAPVHSESSASTVPSTPELKPADVPLPSPSASEGRATPPLSGTQTPVPPPAMSPTLGGRPLTRSASGGNLHQPSSQVRTGSAPPLGGRQPLNSASSEDLHAPPPEVKTATPPPLNEHQQPPVKEEASTSGTSDETTPKVDTEVRADSPSPTPTEASPTPTRERFAPPLGGPPLSRSTSSDAMHRAHTQVRTGSAPPSASRQPLSSASSESLRPPVKERSDSPPLDTVLAQENEAGTSSTSTSTATPPLETRTTPQDEASTSTALSTGTPPLTQETIAPPPPAHLHQSPPRTSNEIQPHRPPLRRNGMPPAPRRIGAHGHGEGSEATRLQAPPPIRINPPRGENIRLVTNNTTGDASPVDDVAEIERQDPQSELMANLKGWAANIGSVVGHEAVAVGLTTALREVVSGLVRAAQNNAPGTEKAQEAAAGALIALIGLGNLMAMASRRARGTNTGFADAGNVIQIAGLISSALSAKETGQLRDLLPTIARTFVYAGLRDSANAIKPYKITPGVPEDDTQDRTLEPLIAQLINTVPYGFNQFFVNWGQGSLGMSGAGFADKLHEISQISNQTEKDEASLQLAKEAPLQLFAYVGANTAGEIMDKIASSVFEQAVGHLGVPNMRIGHEDMHWPTGSEWGNAAEKTVSRMSLFGSVLGNSAALGTVVAAQGYSDYRAAMSNNAIGGAMVTALCLPFVMTLMKKARASARSSNNV